MQPMTTTKRTLKLGITKSNFGQHLQRFIEAKTMAAEADRRAKDQRDALNEYVAKRGIEDDKGNVWMEADGVGRLKRERRVSNVFDADFAEEWLKEHGGDLWDDCTTTITVIDEDVLLAKIYEGLIPEDVVDKLYTERETWAVKVEEF